METMKSVVDVIWVEAERAFDEWLAAQSDEVHELGVAEQIDLYAADVAANDNEARRAAA